MLYKKILFTLSLVYLSFASSVIASPMGTYVGQLHERWQFPSDHLPIAITYCDLHLASWNVLDSNSIDWITKKNTQGLSHSLIAKEHVYIENSLLTIRDKHIVDKILLMITHPTHPRCIISLQECSPPFIEELQSRLPHHFVIIFHKETAILFHQNYFELVREQEVSGVFSSSPERTFQDLLIRRLSNGQLFRLINVHMPGDPKQPNRFEFIQYLANTFDSTITTIAMGDLNFNELEITDALQQTFRCSPFSLHSPYCTNISPYAFTSKAIDHFLVYSPTHSLVIENSPNQVLPELSFLVSLLEGN